jgi:HD-GYP domain-containing protein (c-di-GMP phosphodiesterase class II)
MIYALRVKKSRSTSMSIKQTLFLSIVGLMLITVSSIMFSTYQSTEKVLIGHAHEVMATISKEAIDRSVGFLEPAQLAAELTQRLANNNVVSDKNVVSMERYFFEQLSLYPQFSGIYFASTDGGFIYVMRDDSHSEAGFRTKIITINDGARSVDFNWRDREFNSVAQEQDNKDSYDPRVRPWYIKATKLNRLVWTEPYIFFTSQQPGITISSPVHAVDDNNVINGVIGVDITISQISSFLSKLHIGQSGSAFIIDTQGQVLAHPDADKISRRNFDRLTFTRITEIDDPIARAAFRSLKLPLADTYQLDKKRITRFNYNDTFYQAVFTPFQQHQWPWIFGIYVPEDDYLGVFHKNQRNNIILALVIGIIASLMGIVLARSMSKPITRLGQKSTAIMQGNWDSRPIHTRYAEIRQTADAFGAMTTMLKNQQKLNRDLNKTLQKNSLATIFRLSQAAEYKNPIPGNHLTHMAQLAALIAQKLGMDKLYCETILHAAPMHDIGNLGIPDHILLKPEKLDIQEWEIIKTHPLIGAEILKNPETEMLAMARRIILNHHEKWNGYGYPQGLAGNDIPLEGRICALADAFDTMVSERVYKPAYELDTAFKEVRAGKGSHFDPKCVDALLDCELQIRRIYSNIPNLDDFI